MFAFLRFNAFRKRFLALGLYSLSFLFVSCAVENLENVNPNSVAQDFHVTVHEGGDTVVDGYLEFGRDGFPVRLSMRNTPKASLRANGQLLTEEYEGSYKTTIPGEKLSHTFVYTDSNGKTYENKIQATPIHLAPLVSQEIKRNAPDLKIAWIGDQLAKDESLSIYLEGRSKDRDGLAFSSLSGDKIEKSAWDNFRSGDVTMTLSRTLTTPIKNGTDRKGSMRATYETRKVTFNLVD